MPQPYLVPVSPTFSRIAQSSGVSGSTSTVKDLPLIVRFAIAIPFHWSIHQWTREAICPPKLSGSNQESALVSLERFRKVSGKKFEMAGLNALLWLLRAWRNRQAQKAHDAAERRE